jgi:hypothetical protein
MLHTAGHVARMEDMKNAYNVWTGKPEGKRLIGHLGVDRRIILKWMLEKIGSNDVDWIHLAQERVHLHALLNTVMNLRVP